jgi:hypothetical protein
MRVGERLQEKTVLYNLIERDIGLPLSKEIRRRSRVQTKTPKPEVLITDKIITEEVTSSKKGTGKPMVTAKSVREKVPSVILEQLLSKCGKCQTLQQILEGS